MDGLVRPSTWCEQRDRDRSSACRGRRLRGRSRRTRPPWYRNIEAIEWKTPPPQAVGSRLAFVARFLGRRLAYTYEVSEIVPGERLVMCTAEGPFRWRRRTRWQDAPDGGHPDDAPQPEASRPGFSKLSAPIMAMAMRRTNGKDLREIKRLPPRREGRQTTGGGVPSALAASAGSHSQTRHAWRNAERANSSAAACGSAARADVVPVEDELAERGVPARRGGGERRPRRTRPAPGARRRRRRPCRSARRPATSRRRPPARPSRCA